MRHRGYFKKGKNFEAAAVNGSLRHLAKIQKLQRIELFLMTKEGKAIYMAALKYAIQQLPRISVTAVERDKAIEFFLNAGIFRQAASKRPKDKKIGHLLTSGITHLELSGTTTQAERFRHPQLTVMDKKRMDFLPSPLRAPVWRAIMKLGKSIMV